MLVTFKLSSGAKRVSVALYETYVTKHTEEFQMLLHDEHDLTSQVRSLCVNLTFLWFTSQQLVPCP